MKAKNIFICIIPILLFLLSGNSDKNEYEGRFCSGTGDLEYLRLIDESFAFFNPNPVVPNLTMVYSPEWDTFVEGAGWGGWWIQNSYGFSYSVTPYLQEPWFTLLQRSWDLHWKNQGDGRRKGLHGKEGSLLYDLVGPSGSLGDAAAPDFIVYKQGDGNVKIHDWYYEGTAAGVVMQAEMLLAGRNAEAIEKYLPYLERSCDFIETARDPENNLFLAGPAANLLAPSYGGIIQPDGTFGKGYLAGISITYLAALDRMVELYKLAGNQGKLEEYSRRQKITRNSLPQLLAPAGYFVKSLEKDGTRHGVLGQERYGYLEGVANADAVALRVVDDRVAMSIYNQIAAYPHIRPFDFLLTNAPGLDDTYWNWGNTSGQGFGGFHKFGDWVNGGAWGTVEGRAILMYSRLGKFDDIRRSAYRAMRWAKDFRMDAPWSQMGENSHNPWSDSGKFQVNGVAVMIDNFAIPAATLRGLFDYEYRHDRLILRPRLPLSVKKYKQKQPVRFGEKQLFLTCINGGPDIKSVKVNGKSIKILPGPDLELLYEELPAKAEIVITTSGGKHEPAADIEYPLFPALVPLKKEEIPVPVSMPESVSGPYDTLLQMKNLMESEGIDGVEHEYVKMALESIESYGIRTSLNPGEGYYRKITPQRKEGIVKFYEQSSLAMYKGFKNRMERYSSGNNNNQKKTASLYQQLLNHNKKKGIPE